MLQQNIGSRLENARKALGITIQQAAEQTKIRSDFLTSIEKNEFEMNLPEVYRQGFIRLYANYLKLDGNEVVKDYRTQNNKPSFTPKKTNLHEDLGNDPVDGSHEGKGKFQRHFTKPQPTNSEEELAWDEKPKKPELDRSFLIKFGMIFGGSLVAVLLLAIVINRFLKSDDTHQQTHSASAPASQHSANTAAKPTPSEEEIFLVATGDVHVVVRQESDKKRLFSGTLADGDRVSIHKKGTIKVYSTAGQNLILERNGKQYGMNAQGVATTAFD